MKTLFLLISLVCLVDSVKSQTSFSGSIKRNFFEQTKLNMSAVPDNAPGFTADALIPQIKNSFSYTMGFEKKFYLGKNFGITADVALDMMQLNIVSGIQKVYSSNGITYYASKEQNELIPRIRAGFGIDVLDVQLNKTSFVLGMNAAQLISLQSDIPSYSVLGASLKIATKNISFFVKGSLMPYNIQISNISEYVGDLNAKVLHFENAYRIKELQLGFSIPIKKRIPGL